MAWFDAFTKQDRSDVAPVLRDREQILAYLEALARQGSELLVHLPGDTLEPYAVGMEQVSETRGMFSVRLRSRPLREPGKGMWTEFWFNLESRRFLAKALCLGRSSPMFNEFRLPECISQSDRRRGPRARFRSREKAQVLALESIHEGICFSGQLLNLGQQGCAFRLEKAIDIQTNRRLPLSRSLLSSVSKLSLIRLKDLPATPDLDLSGVVSRREVRSDGLVVGLAFSALGPAEAQVIEKLVLARAPIVDIAFPRKQRQAAQAQAEGSGAKAAEGPAAPGAAEVVPEAGPGAAEPAAPAKLPGKALSPAETQRLLKRCSRQLLLVMVDDLEREFFAARLRAAGYRGIHEARGWLPALHKTRKVALDLILMNQQLGPNTALEVIDSLRSNGLSEQVQVVVLKYQEDVRLTLAAKAGRLVLVNAEPLAFQEVLLPGLEALLGLAD